MDEGVTTVERDVRPWAILVMGVLVAAVVVVVLFRLLASVGDDEGIEAAEPAPSTPPSAPPSTPASTPGSPGPTATTITPPSVSATTGPEPLPPVTGLLGTGEVSAAPDPDLPLGERTNLHLVFAADGELVEWDLDTFDVIRHPVDLRPDAPVAPRLYISPGELLVWPAGGSRLVAVTPGRVDRPETVARDVIDAQPGWSTGSVVVRTRDGVGELGADGRYIWGPAEPPEEIDGRLMGAADGRAYLYGERLRTWGPGETALDAPAVTGLGSLPVAFGPHGPIWLSAAGTLNIPLGGQELSLPAAAAEFSDGWDVQGASVAPNGRVAITLDVEGTHPSTLILVDGDGTVQREIRVRAELLRMLAGNPPLTRLRWSPDSRWLLLADGSFSTLMAYRPDRGRVVLLPDPPVGGATDATLVRVTR